MNRTELSRRFANMWRQSREDAEKSQQYMATALGVSKQTVQNWESGTSCPSQIKGFEWFDVCGVQPMAYYLQLLYPEFDGIKPSDDDRRIEDALIKFIHETTPAQKRKLMYMVYGIHGSSPSGIIEMITAHLHSPLHDRLNVASSILMNYELAEADGTLVAPENIKPDIELLRYSINKGKKAVLGGRRSYTIADEED